MKDILRKQAISPGLCSEEELNSCKEFLTKLQLDLDIYKAAYTVDPIGFMLQSNIDTIIQVKTLRGYK